MGEKRLPGLLKQMRAAITRGDLTACLQLQEKIENEWDAITNRMGDIAMECGSLQMALDDLMDGEW